MAGFKRAISSRIVEQSRFLKLSPVQQILYMQLCLHADDEGVAEGRMSCLLCGASDEELQALEKANLIKILNDDPVIFITDWDEHNTIRSDRIIPSVYHDLLASATDKNESECNTSDNSTQPVKNMTEETEAEEKTESSDNSLSDNELTESVDNACHFDKDLTHSDNICQQNDKTCQNSDTICQPNTIQYNTSNISQEKKKNIQKEKREVLDIKSCSNALSRHFGHYDSETAGLLLEWMRDKDPGTLDSWVKRLKELSAGKLKDATEIISKSVRCNYRDFYPLQTQNSPRISFPTQNNSIVKDRTSQYEHVQDDSITL